MPSGSSGNHRETDRMEYFSDAVMAIAATLLAIDLPMPLVSELEGQSLLSALWHHWTSYVGFLTSFFFIGIAWANHHHMLQFIKRTDQIFLMLNLFFLIGIVLYGDMTKLVLEHLGNAGEKSAFQLYHLLLFFTASIFNALWWYAGARKLLEEDLDPKFIRKLKWEYLLAPSIHLVALCISFWSVGWSLLPLASVYILFMLPRTSDRLQASSTGSE